MHAWSKITLILTLILALSACGPFNPINPTPINPPGSDTPSPVMTAAVTPTVVSGEPIPPIASLKMVDAEEGWAWTSSTKLLHTSDGGRTWVDRTPEGQILPDGFFALDGNTAWLTIFLQDANRFGLLQTTDGGQTWTEYPSGPPMGLHFIDKMNGWAESGEAGAGNIYYSLSQTTDGGKTWATIPAKPLNPEESLPAGTIHLCNLCNDSFFYDPSRMVIVHGDMGSMQPGGAVRMQLSTDLGNSWQTLNLPLPQGSPDALVAPHAPVFFGTKDGLLPVSLVKFDNSGGFIYKRLAIYITQDGGASWSLAPGVLENVVQYAQIMTVSAKDIIVLCGNTLCASHDGAQTWQTLNSNLDFTQNDTRSVQLLDFLNSTTGWVSITENEASTLYKTVDGGANWTQLSPLLVASPAVVTQVDTSIPTPTLEQPPTSEPTPTPQLTFDQGANAYRIRFAQNGTWEEINDVISANSPRRYVLSAMQGQIMSISIPQGPPFTVLVTDINNKPLGNSSADLPFWRGALPATQDYIVKVTSQVDSKFTMRVAINPKGKVIQNFGFYDPNYRVSISYPDEFAPTDVQIPWVTPKGTPLLTLVFIDSDFYAPITNLSESFLMLAASSDPAIVSTCTQPSTQVAETVTGTVNISKYIFTRSEFSGAAAGNMYNQVAYRTVLNEKCFEMILLIHSSNIGNYPPGTVVEYNQPALMSKFETVLNTFLVK